MTLPFPIFWRAAAAALMLHPTNGAAQIKANDMSDLVQVSLLPGGLEADGTQMAALHIVLASGWKTYWRAPGDGGLPTRLDFAGSENLDTARLMWPTPQVFRQNGLRSIGYRDEVVVPIAMRAASDGAPIRLRADMTFGVCEEVCLPVHLTLNHDFTNAESANVALISAAMADRPVPAAQAGLRSVECAITYGDDNAQIEVTLDLPPLAGRGEALVIEPSDPSVWISEPALTRAGDIVSARATIASSTGHAFQLDLSKTRMTVLTTRAAVDIPGC